MESLPGEIAGIVGIDGIHVGVPSLGAEEVLQKSNMKDTL